MKLKANYFLLFLFLLLRLTQAQEVKPYYQEPYRLQFHFTPESKWMNDPNGLVYLDGKYHLFYQYYPHDIVWGPMHWGHASSSDLLHWEHHPIALYPDSLGNIFSGSAIIDKNNTAGFGKNAMIAIFTYHNDSLWVKGFRNTESQGIAYSLDGGITFTKYKNNPVLNNSGEQDFRDPKVFWNDEINLWNMVLAVGDKIKIFTSPNLKDWKFESDFKPQDDVPNLGVWECPDLIKINVDDKEKWVMIINHGSNSITGVPNNSPNGGSSTRYFVGDFDGKTFTNEQPSIWLDYGTDFYAGVTFSNVPNDKKILISWMSNWLYAQSTPQKIWRSAMTLPRELNLHFDGKQYFLSQSIIENFNDITNNYKNFDSVNLPFKFDMDFSQSEIKFVNSNSELIIEFSNSRREKFVIELNDSSLITDRRISGKTNFNENFANTYQSMPLYDSIYNFQIILDRASIEILLNDGKYSMTNIFFPNEHYTKMEIISECNSKIKNLEINNIERVWPNLKMDK